jgi:hypothetical protein
MTGIVLETHPESRCAGDVCCIHNPSDHHMRDWQQLWRGDRGIVERLCAHGIGHPDPDDLRVRRDPAERVHGCDGCCVARPVRMDGARTTFTTFDETHRLPRDDT